MNKKIIIAVIIVAVAAFIIWLFSGSGFNPNAPHVNLNITNGNGYNNTLNNEPNYHYECTITNTGTLTARNVRLLVTFYDANHAIISARESTNIGDIPAGTSKEVSIDVPCPTQPIASTNITPLFDG
jgi:hypothetical protein